jgi:hypothetical protein
MSIEEKIVDNLIDHSYPGCQIPGENYESFGIYFILKEQTNFLESVNNNSSINQIFLLSVNYLHEIDENPQFILDYKSNGFVLAYEFYMNGSVDERFSLIVSLTQEKVKFFLSQLILLDISIRYVDKNSVC